MKKNSILSFCFLFFLGMANAQVKVPQTVIGNWINEQNNSWEYGFFEHFAIYESDFWEYEEIEAGKRRIEIRLKKGNEQVSLKVKPSKDGQLAISRNNEKFRKFKLNKPGFFPHPHPDSTSFKNSGFQQDTVTIIGYYRHLDEYQKEVKNGRKTDPFKVSVPNFILSESVEYFADFDSLGCFSIKFPVWNTQEVYLDWGRLTRQDVVEPGEVLFLFVDMADFIPTEEEKGRDGWAALHRRPKKILYMGKEARFHNELAHYVRSSDHFDRREAISQNSTDMDFLAAANQNYKTRVLHLEEYVKSYPTLSERFKEYSFAYEKYKLAFHLMQFRFEKRRKKEIAFDDGYMDFIKANMEFNDSGLFALVRDYSNFIRDYVGYYNDVNNLRKDEASGELVYEGQQVILFEVLSIMKSQGHFSEQEERVISEFQEALIKINSELGKAQDSTATTESRKLYEKTIHEYRAIMEKPEISKVFFNIISEKTLNVELQLIDSLFKNKKLKELLVARTLCYSLNNKRSPLSENLLAVLFEKITNPFIKKYLLDVHQHYVDIENKEISYLASLKNTDHLKESKDADSLFSQLIAPYKGKVIYLDCKLP